MLNISISVVITVYNDAQYLERALSSVVNQSVSVSNIIVVNDGSDPANTLLIEDTIKLFSFSKITSIYQVNKGPSEARKYGLTKCTSSHVCFLDVDDEWGRDRVRDFIINIKKFPNVGAFYTNSTERRENDIESRVEQYQSCRVMDKHNFESVGVVTGSGIPCGLPFYCFDLECFSDELSLNSNYRWYEDLDYIIRLLFKGEKLMGIESDSFIRNVRDNSHSKSRSIDSVLGPYMVLHSIASDFPITKRNMKFRELYLRYNDLINLLKGRQFKIMILMVPGFFRTAFVNLMLKVKL